MECSEMGLSCVCVLIATQLNCLYFDVHGLKHRYCISSVVDCYSAKTIKAWKASVKLVSLHMDNNKFLSQIFRVLRIIWISVSVANSVSLQCRNNNNYMSKTHTIQCMCFVWISRFHSSILHHFLCTVKCHYGCRLQNILFGQQKRTYIRLFVVISFEKWEKIQKIYSKCWSLSAFHSDLCHYGKCECQHTNDIDQYLKVFNCIRLFHTSEVSRLKQW